MYTRRQMATFFAALNEQVAPGFANQPIVNTMMGPFTFNPATQSWTNVNNGMRISNAEFQNMMSGAGDYSTTDGGNITNTGIVYGTIPMVFSPATYNITSNYGEGSTVTFTPSILVPTGTSNFKIKWISDGGYQGGTLSKLSLVRTRSGTGLVVNPFVENTATPGGPVNMAGDDILTFAASAAATTSIGTEQYSFYIYDNASGNTLSGQITINANIPAVTNPLLVNTEQRELTNITVSGCTYMAGAVDLAIPELTWNYVSVFNFLNNNAAINYKLYFADVVGSTFPRFAIDDNASTNELSTSILENQGFTVAAGTGFRVGAFMQPAGGSTLSGSGNIIVYNNTAGQTLATIPYSFNLPVSDTVPTVSGSFGSITGITGTTPTWYAGSGGGVTGAPLSSFVTFSDFTQAFLMGVSFTSQAGPINPGITQCEFFLYSATGAEGSFSWGAAGSVQFSDFNNRFPVLPGYRGSFSLDISSLGTGTGSGNILLYDFTNNSTLATIPYTINKTS